MARISARFLNRRITVVREDELNESSREVYKNVPAAIGRHNPFTNRQAQGRGRVADDQPILFVNYFPKAGKSVAENGDETDIAADEAIEFQINDRIIDEDTEDIYTITGLSNAASQNQHWECDMSFAQTRDVD